MARDPLSISAPILPSSGVPQAIQQAVGFGIQKEQLRRQKDQDKLDLLTKLQNVEAVGWERDQRFIDGLVNKYEDDVTRIMVERDGNLLPQDIRNISSQKNTIKQITAKSVADKKNYEDAFKFARTHHDKLNSGGVYNELDNYYSQPIMQRQLFDFTPYFKPEFIDERKLFPVGDLGKVTTTNPDGTRSVSFKTAEYANNVKARVQSGGDYREAFEQAVKSGRVRNIDEYASNLALIAENAADLNTSMRTIGADKKDSGIIAGDVRFLDGKIGSGYFVEGGPKKMNLTVPFGDGVQNAEFNMNSVGVHPETGEPLAIGVAKVRNTPNFISYEEYNDLKKNNEAEAGKYVYDRDERAYKEKGTGVYVLQPMEIPWGQIKEEVTKAYLPGLSDYSDAVDITGTGRIPLSYPRSAAINRIKNKVSKLKNTK